MPMISLNQQECSLKKTERIVIYIFQLTGLQIFIEKVFFCDKFPWEWYFRSRILISRLAIFVSGCPLPRNVELRQI